MKFQELHFLLGIKKKKKKIQKGLFSLLNAKGF